MEIQTYCEFVAEDSQLDAVSRGQWEAMRGQQSAYMLGFMYHHVLQAKKKKVKHACWKSK